MKVRLRILRTREDETFVVVEAKDQFEAANKVRDNLHEYLKDVPEDEWEWAGSDEEVEMADYQGDLE